MNTTGWLRRAVFFNTAHDALILTVPTQSGYPIDAFRVDRFSGGGQVEIPTTYHGNYSFAGQMPCGALRYHQDPRLGLV
jgi:hypothetical protein